MADHAETPKYMNLLLNFTLSTLDIEVYVEFYYSNIGFKNINFYVWFNFKVTEETKKQNPGCVGVKNPNYVGLKRIGLLEGPTNANFSTGIYVWYNQVPHYNMKQFLH